MNRRKFRTAPEILLAQGKELLKTVKDRRYSHRIATVNLVLGGMSSKQVSEFIKESRVTVDRWVKIVNEQGWEQLKGKSPSRGRPTKITEEIATELEKMIQENPEIYGYAEWNGITLSELLKRYFQIKYSVRSSQRLLHELNFSLLRLRTFPAKDRENNTKRRIFKKNGCAHEKPKCNSLAARSLIPPKNMPYNL